MTACANMILVVHDDKFQRDLIGTPWASPDRELLFHAEN